jgi:tRNA (cytidine/uridine-2'-O-)-methyltransferase
MRLALYKPEIAGNVGAIIRSCAAFRVPLDIIMPCGFPFSDKSLARAGMDYARHAEIIQHADWPEFRASRGGRVVLMTTHATTLLHDFAFQTGDTLLLGQESAGVPPEVRAACDESVRIAMAPELRSLNISVSAGVAMHEMLRQLGGLPDQG